MHPYLLETCSVDAVALPSLTRLSRSAVGGNQKEGPRRNSRYYVLLCMSCFSVRNPAKENAPINGRAYVRLTLTISRISPHLDYQVASILQQA